MSKPKVARLVVDGEILPHPPSSPPEPSRSGGSEPPRARGGAGEALSRELANLPATDLGNAKRFLRRFGHLFLFVREWGWLVWDGRRWARSGAEGQLEDMIKRTIELIGDEVRAVTATNDDRVVGQKRKKPVQLSEALAEWALKSQQAGHVNCIKGLVQSDRERHVSVFDADPMLINLLNGTLVVRKDSHDPYVQLKPHDRDDLITKLAQVAYDPEATCPLFDRFLDRVQPDVGVGGSKPTQRFLDQWGGLSLTGDASEQKLAFFWGKGRNGKSVWVDTVAHITGDYAETVPIETFLDSGRARRGGEASPDLAILPGVRLLRTSEPEKGAKLAESLIKLTTGGEPIKARHLNRDFFSFQPQFKLTIQGNYRPKIDGTDEGIWGRLYLIPWKIFIPPAERDPNLARKLRDEAPGILNRLLAGLCDWMDNGLTIPEAVTEATEAYRADSDPLGRFLATCTATRMGARVQSSDMHRVFCAWAKANGEREWTSTGLGRALRERGIPDKKADVIWWLDIELTKGVGDFIDWEGNVISGGSKYGDE